MTEQSVPSDQRKFPPINAADSERKPEMQSRGIRVATVTISLTGIVALFCLAGSSGDLKKGNWGELAFASLFFTFPSVFLASLGYRRTTSDSLPAILLCCSMLSTGLWGLVALYFATDKTVDAQSGLMVGIVFLIQLGIAVVAGLCFLFLTRASDKSSKGLHWSLQVLLTLSASLIGVEVLPVLLAGFGRDIGGDAGRRVVEWLSAAIGLLMPWIFLGLRHRKSKTGDA